VHRVCGVLGWCDARCRTFLPSPYIPKCTHPTAAGFYGPYYTIHPSIDGARSVLWIPASTDNTTRVPPSLFASSPRLSLSLCPSLFFFSLSFAHSLSLSRPLRLCIIHEGNIVANESEIHTHTHTHTHTDSHTLFLSKNQLVSSRHLVFVSQPFPKIRSAAERIACDLTSHSSCLPFTIKLCIQRVHIHIYLGVSVDVHHFRAPCKRTSLTLAPDYILIKAVSSSSSMQCIESKHVQHQGNFVDNITHAHTYFASMEACHSRQTSTMCIYMYVRADHSILKHTYGLLEDHGNTH
jgi:hypothetical protein